MGQPPLTKPAADGSLYFLTRKLISEPKIVNNARVVVVGCSDAAIALLEALITVPYLYFSYLYLVVPRARERLLTPRGEVGVERRGGRRWRSGEGSESRRWGEGGGESWRCGEGGGESMRWAESGREGEDEEGGRERVCSFFARSCGYTAEELIALGLGSRVRLVESRVVDIDRTAKAVMLPDDSILPYDFLVLAPEFADQSLQPLGPDAVGVSGAFSIVDEEAGDRPLPISPTKCSPSVSSSPSPSPPRPPPLALPLALAFTLTPTPTLTFTLTLTLPRLPSPSPPTSPCLSP